LYTMVSEQIADVHSPDLSVESRKRRCAVDALSGQHNARVRKRRLGTTDRVRTWLPIDN
jgi:hypothetical protein